MESIKYRPILFSGDMVRAILDGRKTQTRRVVKGAAGAASIYAGERDGIWAVERFGDAAHAAIRCPYGVPGERLWVRETWMHTVADTGMSLSVIAYRADGKGKCAMADNEGHGDFIGIGQDASPWITDEHRWRPSIFMPRWASRITLEVTDVRVERVQDISEDDAIAEGVQDWCVEADPRTGEPIQVRLRPSEEFANLWDSINAARGFGWDTNPWVWVASFRRIDRRDNARHQKAAC